MSMSSALNNAVTGLTASARMAEVVSSNLSNALTDGYGRRSVELSSVQVGDVGGGVRVDTINRFVDAGLLSDRRLADAALNGQERSAAMMLRLEQALGGPEDAAGLGARLAEFEKALISASSDPASEARLANVVSRLQDVTSTLNANTRATQSLRQEADSVIARDIDVLNSALVQVDAMKVAEYLSQHEKVSWVSYAGLPSSEFYPLAEKYMQGKPSAILSFGLKDGYEAGVRFYDALQIFKRLVNIGDAKSLACHPASTTHRQLSEAEQKQAGVSPEMIRLSVGIEHIEDILADLEQALNA